MTVTMKRMAARLRATHARSCAVFAREAPLQAVHLDAGMEGAGTRRAGLVERRPTAIRDWTNVVNIQEHRSPRSPALALCRRHARTQDACHAAKARHGD